MKYLKLVFAMSCGLLSFFHVQGMEIIDMTQQPELTFHLITTEQILDYLHTHMGVDLQKIHVNIADMDQEHQQHLAGTIKNMLPLIGTAFDRLANQLPNSNFVNQSPSSSELKVMPLSKIVQDIGFPLSKELSKDLVTFYTSHLNAESQQDKWTILELNSYLINSSILETISKIIMTTIAQNKPLDGILLVHNASKQQIGIAAAPQHDSSIFGKGFSLGVDLTSPRNKSTPGKASTGTLTSPLTVPSNMPAGLGTALGLMRGIDQELTNLENNPNLSDNTKACISKVHKPVIFIIAIFSLVIVAWQFYIGIEKVIHGGNSSF